MGQGRQSQRGAAAIFIVVFFAILISIIALSFLRIAVQDQQQSTNDDLSRSAYDSASAGTEDAQRALSWYNLHCPSGVALAPGDVTACGIYTTAFTNPNNRCNLADIIRNPVTASTLPHTATTTLSGTEVKVSTNAVAGSDDEKLDQAYTCVTVTTQTIDYKGGTSDGKSDTLIPLKTVGDVAVSKIELNWFYFESGDHSATFTPNYPDPVQKPLPVSNTAWPSQIPIMRFQLIPVTRGNIDINTIDTETRALFLYPSKSALAVNPINLTINDPARHLTPPAPIADEKPVAPTLTKCLPLLNPGQYACKAEITIPGAANTDYYLRLGSIYNLTKYQIKLYDSADTALLFDNVAPEIDSTGRASDVFRRIQSRVRFLTSSNPLSDGGFDVTKGVCKDFDVPVYNTNCPDPQLVNP